MRRRFACNYKIGIHNEIWYTSTNSAIVIPYSVFVFGANIISNTYLGNKGIIKFDSDVTFIGSDAFFNCSKLTSVTIPNSVTKIEIGAFSYCSSLASITIPEGVTEIGGSAFFNCSSLTSVTIPESVTTIGSAAFYGCSSLTSITIPDSVTKIEASTFSYCSSLTSVTIGDSVTSISNFYGCDNLKIVYCKPTIPPTGVWKMFDNNASGRKIYVPYQSLDDYKTAEYWSDYADAIVGYDFEQNEVVGLITFTVDGTEYQAKEGMTWSEFVNSVFNTNNNFSSTGVTKTGGQIKDSNNINVNEDTILVANESYWIQNTSFPI